MAGVCATFRRFRAVLGVAFLSCLAGCGPSVHGLFGNIQRDEQAAVLAPRPWAEPIDVPGVDNVYRVDARLYRGAHPSAEGLRNLEALGVRTVVNLRVFHSSEPLLEETSLEFVEIPMAPWRAEPEQIAAFLRVVTDPDRGPVFVHCMAGSDRVGLMVAAYRVAVQGWTKEQAIDEMTRGGFAFHWLWNSLIDNLRQTDLAEVRRLAGLPAPRAAPLAGVTAAHAVGTGTRP